MVRNNGEVSAIQVLVKSFNPSLSSCEYPFSTGFRVLEAYTIGFSVPSSRTWDSAPTPYREMHASVASVGKDSFLVGS